MGRGATGEDTTALVDVGVALDEALQKACKYIDSRLAAVAHLGG